MQLPLCSNAYDDVIDFEIWILQKQKSRYLKNGTLFFLQIKNLIALQGLLYGKNSLVAEVTFNLEMLNSSSHGLF